MGASTVFAHVATSTNIAGEVLLRIALLTRAQRMIHSADPRECRLVLFSKIFAQQPTSSLRGRLAPQLAAERSGSTLHQVNAQVGVKSFAFIARREALSTTCRRPHRERLFLAHNASLNGAPLLWVGIESY